MDILEIAIIIIVFILLCIPTGKYFYKVAENEKTFLDPVCDRIDNFIYKITGITKDEMSWKQYLAALLSSNAVAALIAYIVLRIQSVHILNPNHTGSMNPALTFNTVISFMTNTNLQDYSGESGLSYLSQMIVITFFMFLAASTGLAIAFTFMRGFQERKLSETFMLIL